MSEERRVDYRTPHIRDWRHGAEHILDYRHLSWRLELYFQTEFISFYSSLNFYFVFNFLLRVTKLFRLGEDEPLIYSNVIPVLNFKFKLLYSGCVIILLHAVSMTGHLRNVIRFECAIGSEVIIIIINTLGIGFDVYDWDLRISMLVWFRIT